MADNTKPEFSKMHNNIIMIKDELKNMLDKEAAPSDLKEKLNQFVE